MTTPINTRPPDDCLVDAIGWRNNTESDPDASGRWRVKSWTIFYADHVMEVGLDGVPFRDSVLYRV